MAALCAVLFDLDGTLVDSDRQQADALVHCLRLHDISIEPADHAYFAGRSWSDVYARLCERYPIGLTMVQVIDGTARELAKTNLSLYLMPGAAPLLELLKGRVPLALVSGASREELETAILRSGLTVQFDVLLTSEDYRQGKPSPEGYLQCARKLGLSPECCLVFEDSQAGIRAATAAGMRCVAVRTGCGLKQDQSEADEIIDTLERVDRAFLERLGVRMK